MKRVLFLGESWSVSQTNIKGYDHVTTGRYEECGEVFINALKTSGIEVDYMPSHVAHIHFPFDTEELKCFSAVILSDIGSNTFLLHPDTQRKCIRMPNRLEVLTEYIRNGGGLLTIGGYMSYSGIDGKARYAMTPLSEVMPVEMLHYDDRMEHPEGVYPNILKPEHPVLIGIDIKTWPHFLGYNKMSIKPGAEQIAEINGNVFMAAMDFGKGRSFAFASDCVPHWASPEFVSWQHYKALFRNIINWLDKDI